MKCSKCQLYNPEDNKFCRKCGVKFSLKCSQCSAEIHAEDMFCGKCGHNLQKPKESTNYSKPKSYTPKFLADKILTTRTSIEGERKLVTVFFADVVNYTALSEKLDPEEVHQIMDGAFKILMDEIHRYEGAINQFTGDGVMALFGAPIAHEDHAQRACFAALSIQKAMEGYGIKIEKDCEVQFQMRIGLNSGPVIVGSIGDDLRMDYTAVGDTTNLAARMEGLAKPDTVMLSENTHKLVRDYFDLQSMGKVDIKGKKEVQNVYKLIKPSKIETRIDASAAKGLTKFVGRKNSMASLMEPLEKVQSGSGQVVGIVGEAGLGKSRLLLEMKNRLPLDEYTWLEGRCIHYGASMAYLPILDILRSYFDIKKGDREFIIKKKIKEKILGFEQKLTKAIPALHDLLSLTIDDDIYKRLDPLSKRERTFEAIRDIFLFENQEKPLVVVVEDLHWIDKTSEDVINYLVGWLQNSKTMLVLLYRPEYNHQWGSKSYYTKIGLDQLGTESGSQLVEAILNGDVVSELRELILSRAAGNPLFMEELTHSLLENGSIRQENNKFVLKSSPENIQVPETIEGIISARMDRLEDNLKRTMQVASVIGKDFAFRILNTITDMREDLKSYLFNLQGLEFIYEKRLFPELEYIFKHALIQEVAYNSLLQSRRKEIHEKIGNAIETIYADRVGEFYGMLVYHYMKGENYEKGAKYSKLAGKKVEKMASFNDAIVYSQKRITCLEKLTQTDIVQRDIINARTVLGLYYTQMNFHVEAKTAIDPIVDLAIRLDYKRMLPKIYTIMGAYNYLVDDNFFMAFESFENALKISEQENDIVSTFFINHFWGLALSLNCEFEKAVCCFEKALNINVARNALWGISAMKCMISYFIYYAQGMVDQSYQTSFEAIEISQESGDIYSKAISFISHGISCYGKGFYKEAIKYILKGIDYCERINLFFWNALAQSNLGEIYLELGEYEKAKNHYAKAICLVENKRIIPYWMNLNKTGLVMARVMSNEKDIDLESLYTYDKLNKVNFCEGWIKKNIGEILLYIDNHHMEKAGEWISKAIKADKKNSMMLNLGRDYILYSKFFDRKGYQLKAKKNLNIAFEILAECGVGEIKFSQQIYC